LVKNAPQLNRIVTLYREELAHLGIRVTAIFLYGSYARDTRHEGSELLGTATARVLEPIQAYGLTPEEIKQHSLTSFWSDILEHEAVPVYG